jgi:Tol biopolymer transport system component
MRRTIAGNTDIWVVDVTRPVPERLTSHPAIDWAAEFSPDGERVVFVSDRASGIDDLYERPRSGVGQETLLLASNEQKVPLDWSPDGNHILYAVQSVTTGFDIWALPLEGTRTPFPVVQTPHEDGDSRLGAAFSPDGHWIAFQSNRSGRYEIYLQRFRGDDSALQVSIDGGFSPLWRADGRELFFLTFDNRVMAADVRLGPSAVRLGNPRALFPLPVDASYGEYAVSPDGHRFLISRDVTPPAPVTVLLNWARKGRL